MCQSEQGDGIQCDAQTGLQIVDPATGREGAWRKDELAQSPGVGMLDCLQKAVVAGTETR